MGEYLLEVKNLKKTYPIYRNTGKLFGSKERMNAVDGMSFYSITFWNRRSNAPSLSVFWRYSSNVVAPMH